MNYLVTIEKNELLTSSRSFSALLFEVRGQDGNEIRLVFNPGWGRLRRSRIFSRWRRWRGILIVRNRIFRGYSPGNLAMRMIYLIRRAFDRHWYTVSDECDRRVQLQPPYLTHTLLISIWQWTWHIFWRVPVLLRYRVRVGRFLIWVWVDYSSRGLIRRWVVGQWFLP